MVGITDPVPTPLEEIVITASREIPPTPTPDFEQLNTYSGYEHRVDFVGIVNSENRSTDITNMIRAINIYQDLYASVISGNALIEDHMDLIYHFTMCGNEYFFIQFYNTQKPEQKIIKNFRIYKISDRQQVGNSGNMYTLHFCSDTQLISDSTVINKAYQGKKNNEIVEDILTEYLQIPQDRFEVESTEDTFDHIISNMRPIEAINWLAARSYSKGTGSYCYFFYEMIDPLKNPIVPKFYFKSLKSMFNQNPTITLDMASSKIIFDGISYQYTITKFEIMDEFDILRSTITGGFASRMTGIDIFNQKWNVYEKTLEDEKDNLMNKHLPINKLKEKNDLSLLESYDALDLYYHEIKDNPTAKDNNVEFIMNRAQSLSVLNNFRIKLGLQGSVFLRVGDVIHIEFPAFRPSDPTKQYNQYRGTKETKGKFLITAVNHAFKGSAPVGVYETILELSSDSFASELPAAKQITGIEY